MFETAETTEMLNDLLERLSASVPGTEVTLYHNELGILTAEFEAIAEWGAPFPVLSLSSAGAVCMAISAALEDALLWTFPQIFVELAQCGRRISVGVSYQDDLDEGCASLSALAEHLIPVLEGCALCSDATLPITLECSPLPLSGFPRFWELFRIILPGGVRERVYDPCYEELKEDYLRERSRWPGQYARYWVTFCFTVRTVSLVGQSLWVVTRGSVCRFAFMVLVSVLGLKTVATLRERIVEWLGRLW